MNDRSLHLKRSHHREPQTACTTSTKYSGNPPLRTLWSPVMVWDDANNTLRGILWRLCIRYWGGQKYMKLQKRLENGKVPRGWIKKPFPYTDSTPNMMRVTKIG